jgi:hypothetical protein
LRPKRRKGGCVARFRAHYATNLGIVRSTNRKNRVSRRLAERADPFTKKRLLDLADSYEKKLSLPSQTPLPKPPAASAE